jgi:3-hydroxyisobutyrate dehydrogenase-like beta-hydroxyacid dehydrogenase
MKIGFIGLGIMGSRMAANLQKQGCSLVLFNRTRAKAEPLLGPISKEGVRITLKKDRKIPRMRRGCKTAA